MRTRKPNRPTLELDDYSGPFQPDRHISDFSHEGLMKLLEIGASSARSESEPRGARDRTSAQHDSRCG